MNTAADRKKKKYLFGPVPSRRLGASLGLDLIPYKTCSFNCIYCQLGRTTNKTLERKEYVSVEEIASELKCFLSENPPQIDYVTLGGSGEPTLNTGFGRLIDFARNLTDKPIAVLTNSSLITDEEVRLSLSKADVVLPTLSTTSQDVFEKIHRPCYGIHVEKIIEGLKTFSRNYDSEIRLNVFMVAGYNDDEKSLRNLKDVIDDISPDHVEINTVSRPPAEAYAKAVPLRRLKEIAQLLGGDIIAYRRHKQEKGVLKNIEEEIENMLERRPCTIKDISASLSIHINEASKYVQRLELEGRIKRSENMPSYYTTTKK